LATLIEAWEDHHHPISDPDPIEAIEFRMEQQGLTRKDLEPLIGPRGRVSEVLSGKRCLTLPMIRRLSARLKIPAEVLIKDTTA
jgi:HTH-type transcriptional regulator/antitoxin HigA